MRMQIPIVCLQTWEETIALMALRQIATRLNRDFLTWSASRGLMRSEGQPMGDLYRDPVRALEFIRRQKQKRICVLLDFRPCLEDPTVVRMLREMVMAGETSRTMLVLTGPKLPVPPELMSACASFYWPEGDGGDLLSLYEKVRAEVAASSGRAVELGPADRDALLENLREMPVGRIRFEIARFLLDRAASPEGRID